MIYEIPLSMNSLSCKSIKSNILIFPLLKLEILVVSLPIHPHDVALYIKESSPNLREFAYDIFNHGT